MTDELRRYGQYEVRRHCEESDGVEEFYLCSEADSLVAGLREELRRTQEEHRGTIAARDGLTIDLDFAATALRIVERHRDQYRNERDSLRAELAAAKANDARYRWLRLGNGGSLGDNAQEFWGRSDDEIDAAIDSSIAAVSGENP